MRSSPPKALLLVLPVLMVGMWFLMGTDPVDRDPKISSEGLAPNRNLQVPEDEPKPLTTEGDVLADPGSRDQGHPTVSGTTVQFPLEIDLTLLSAGNVPEAPDTLPKGSGATARLKGRIADNTAEPCAATIEFLHGPNAGRSLVCNGDGEFGMNDLYPGLAVVEVRTPKGLRARRDVLLRALSTQVLNITFAGPATLYGTILDKTNEPISGAKVTVDGNVAYSNDKGIFHLPKIASGQHIVVVVEAPGYALHRDSISQERQGVVTADYLKYRLEPEASLTVAVPSALGVFQEVEVHLFPAGGSEQRDFPWEMVSPVMVQPGSQVEVKGLRQGTFTAIAYHSGAIAIPKQQSVRVEPTRKNLLEIKLGPGPTIEGMVMREGNPVAGALVELQAPDLGNATTKSLGRNPRFAEQAILPHVAEALQTTRANGHGHFTLTGYGEPGEVRYLSARSPDGSWVGNAVVKVGDADLNIELQEIENKAGSIHVRLDERWQGLSVEVRRNGMPGEPLLLEASDELILDGLEEGLWRIHANWRGSRVIENQQVPVVDGKVVEVIGRLPKAAIEGT
tara:strand:- start:3060 stop:4754 length:1695 start_codon:yes stop_codon:yes gene_type:complete